MALARSPLSLIWITAMAPAGSLCTHESDQVLLLLKNLHWLPISYLILQTNPSSSTPSLAYPVLIALFLVALANFNMLPCPHLLCLFFVSCTKRASRKGSLGGGRHVKRQQLCVVLSPGGDGSAECWELGGGGGPGLECRV